MQLCLVCVCVWAETCAPVCNKRIEQVIMHIIIISCKREVFFPIKIAINTNCIHYSLKVCLSGKQRAKLNVNPAGS